jgi:hypothetical protein
MKKKLKLKTTLIGILADQQMTNIKAGDDGCAATNLARTSFRPSTVPTCPKTS